MNRFLLVILGLSALTATARQVTVVEKTQLLKGVEGAVHYPVLNKTGDRLLFSDGAAQGLKMYDLNDNVVTRISDAQGAGIDAAFGADGNVYYVTQEASQENLIYRTGHCYDVNRASSRVVLEAQHGAVRPEVGTAGIALKGERKSFSSTRNLGTAVFVKGSKIFVTVGGKTREYAPVESHAGYLWPSLSPDGKKVVFFAAGKGIVVIDLEGNVLSMLGNYEMPCWYDNDYVVAQNAKDDGHQFTSSNILILKADGSFKTELTAPTSMTMQPTCAAGKIVYTSIDGQLYLMKISIHP